MASRFPVGVFRIGVDVVMEQFWGRETTTVGNQKSRISAALSLNVKSARDFNRLHPGLNPSHGPGRGRREPLIDLVSGWVSWNDIGAEEIDKGFGRP